MPSTRIDRTHGDYQLAGYRTGVLTLFKNGKEIAAVTKCEERNGWWHDTSESGCADAVILPTARLALLALTAINHEA